LEIPIHPVLEAILDKHKIEGPAYMLTRLAEPFSIKGMSNKVSDWFHEAGLPHCSAHSVRKGLATTLAESSATDSMLDGMFGWSGGQTSKIYTKKKEQARLAWQAVSKISWGEIESILPHPEETGGKPATPTKKIK
jgi:site-specific recombinase XerD